MNEKRLIVILSSSVYYLTVFNNLTMTQFASKHVTQLDPLTVLPNKVNCVETSIDLFIHIIATQRDVTRKNNDNCFCTWFCSITTVYMNVL
jgi:hypothetical protein